ncbi:MAG: hypothetical protein KF881_01520 [Acidobacteria bacterium]|nr:hypothetical protein [Acidobacteriota bacterium]
MSIEGIVLITSVEFTAPKDLELKVNNESKNVVLEKKSPNDFVNGTPDGFKHYTDGTIIFLIDVHCSVLGAEKLQLQGGVVVYRHLLNLFKDKQDKLKVIFYSPLSKDLLVKLRPENYVLKLLPFIECKYDGKFDSDGQAKNTLSGQIAEYEPAKWPRFNNASENLLSGWAIANKKLIKSGKDEEAKIPLNGMKLLIVDDEFSSWATTYLSIFCIATSGRVDKNAGEVLFPPFYSQEDFRQEWSVGDGFRTILEGAEASDAVLSDLYIKENHEDTNPYKSLADLEKISGYQLFKAVKGKYPYLPYMMFTSSNKVWNADAFRSEGVWAWAVKETSVYVSEDNRRAQFDHFMDCIRKLVDPECRFIADVWKRLLELKEEHSQESWWYTREPQALQILEECLFILDTVYSQRSTFETKKVDEFQGRLCSVVLNNLGGLSEILEINPADTRKHVHLVASYIWRIRSHYSHGLYYRQAFPLEVLFCADLFIGLLSLSNQAFRALSNRENWILKDNGRPTNANVNYFRQFFAKKDECDVTFVEGICDSLEKRFSEVYADVISDHYDRKIRDEESKITKDNSSLADLRAVIKMNTKNG